MKHKKLIILILVLLFVSLVVANRFFAKDISHLYKEKKVAIQTNSRTVKTYSLKHFSSDVAQDFTAIYKRKVGPSTYKKYTGIPLLNFIQDAGVTIEDNDTVTIIAQDQYQIVLTAGEVKALENAYIVTRENSSHLSKNSGPFMLVLRKDELSTRWVRQVVIIKINKEH